MWDQEKQHIWRDLKDEYEITDIVYLPEFNYLAFGLTDKGRAGKVCLWSVDTFRKVKEFYENGSGAGALCWDPDTGEKQPVEQK